MTTAMKSMISGTRTTPSPAPDQTIGAIPQRCGVEESGDTGSRKTDRPQSVSACADGSLRDTQARVVTSIQNTILEMIATGEPLLPVLDAITGLVEAQDRELLCSILLVDASGNHLTCAAASSFPKAYNEAIDGLLIGPDVGSCGAAVYRGELVVVADIASDPKWRDFRDLALRHGLRACWSRPILSRNGDALGAFGMYSSRPNETPSPYQLELSNAAAHLASIAIERERLDEEREASRREAIERANRDPLTGLLNHRAFHNRLDRAASQCLESDSGLAVALVDLDSFRFFNDYYGHAVGDSVLEDVAGRLRRICGEGDILARYGGDVFAILMAHAGDETAAVIESRLQSRLGDITYRTDHQSPAIPITVSVGAALMTRDTHDRHAVVKQAEERLKWWKTGGTVAAEAQAVRSSVLSRVSGFSMLDALVTSVDNKDRYTRRHSDDVMEYSLMIARELGLDADTQQMIAVAALLHDVGKIGVPDHILRKPAALTAAEFDAIKQHPQMGAVIVRAIPLLEDTLDAVQHHHERWDGAGYPFGLKGNEIPLSARLMAVADAFSAMTTDRPYRQGMDRVKAISILKAGAGTQWDPGCVDALLRALDPVSGRSDAASARRQNAYCAS